MSRRLLKTLFAFMVMMWCAVASDRAARSGETPPPVVVPAQPASGGRWIHLFNGRNLNGWRPKISGYRLGDNFANTFRVEDGVLKVSYDGYGAFDDRFGYLFFRKAYSHYRLRVEYRFVGAQVPGGPPWAFRNSGVMIHSQPPRTMSIEQAFPVSLEVQLLGGTDTGERSTANLCTLGTRVVMNGMLNPQRCTGSTSKTYRGDVWVTVEVEVRGGETIRHFVEGEEVMSYREPRLDEDDPDAKRLLARRGARRKRLGRGWIALQAESHPTEFRRVDLLLLRRP